MPNRDPTVSITPRAILLSFLLRSLFLFFLFLFAPIQRSRKFVMLDTDPSHPVNGKMLPTIVM